MVSENLFDHPRENLEIHEIFSVSRCEPEKRVSLYMRLPEIYFLDISDSAILSALSIDL
jgi:hypothetical protein